VIRGHTDITEITERVSALQRSDKSHTDLRDLTDMSFGWQRNGLGKVTQNFWSSESRVKFT